MLHHGTFAVTIIRIGVSMRIAVISDIHGNLEAFEKVLDDIVRQKIETIISLGDNIGYGADSEAVIQLLIANDVTSILGNHELACVNERVYKWYIKDVKKSLDKTMAGLSDQSFDYLNRLSLNFSILNACFVHGFPPDSVRHYLHQMDTSKLITALENQKESICFVGHTHRLSRVFLANNNLQVQSLNPGKIQLEKDAKYMINAGSVGQPRDGDLRAKYVIWDNQKHCLDIRYIEYDHQKAARKILAAGLPLKYAQAVDPDIKLNRPL